MDSLHINEAFAYYNAHINRTERFDAIRDHNFSVVGSVPSIDWEVFGAILTGDEKKEGYGSDLKAHEVKSAASGGSYEYQYHKNHGEDKLDEDKVVDHIFIEYSRDYQNVMVRLVKAAALADTFESWRKDYLAKYESGGQRYRKSVAFGFVREYGTAVMTIKGGELVQSDAGPDSITDPK